jgi:hypothetical protein
VTLRRIAKALKFLNNKYYSIYAKKTLLRERSI